MAYLRFFAVPERPLASEAAFRDTRFRPARGALIARASMRVLGGSRSCSFSAKRNKRRRSLLPVKVELDGGKRAWVLAPGSGCQESKQTVNGGHSQLWGQGAGMPKVSRLRFFCDQKIGG